MSSRLRWLLVVLVALVVSFPLSALARNRRLAAPSRKSRLQADPADRSLREQDIYIPYEKLRQVFEQHGRGVFLPYEKFEELWRAAQEKTRPAAASRGRPVGAVITEIENEATVAKDVVRVKATAEDRLAGRGLARNPAAAGRRGHHRRHARRRAGADRRRARRRLPPAGREEGQAARADRARAGICQGDQPDAGPEQRVVPGPAGPGEPLAGADSAGGREGEPAPADCRHRSAAAADGRRRQPKPDEASRRQARTRPSSWPSSARRRRSASTGRPRPKGPPAWPPWSASRPSSRCGSARASPAAAPTWPTRSAAPNWASWPSKCRPTTRWSTSSTPTCGSGRSSRRPAGAKPCRRSPPNCSSRPSGTQQVDRRAGEDSPARSGRTSLTVPVVKALDVGRQQGVVVVQVAAGLRAEAARATGLLAGRCRRAARTRCRRQPGPSPIAMPRCPTSWSWASKRCSRGSRPTRWSRPGSSPSG